MPARLGIRLAAASLMLALLPAEGSAKIVLPARGVPIPSPRPIAETPAVADVPVPSVRPETSMALNMDLAPAGEAEVDAVARRMTGAVAATAADAALRSGLDALASGDVAGALRTAATLPPGSLNREILDWAVSLDGGPDVPSRLIVATERELAGWPGMPALARNAERALYREKAEPRKVIAALGERQPQTMQGVVALTRARLAVGDRDAARATASTFWRSAKLEASEETAFLKEFGSLLSTADHRHRMEQMLYYERVNSALRVAPAAGAKQLAQAWGAMVRKQKQAGKLLDAVPATQRSAGWAYAKAKYLRGKEKYEEAAKVVLAAPKGAEAVVDADAWWTERRVLSRELLDAGDAATAYRIAAGHSAESPEVAADAEFHAGWYALRGLHDPAKAAMHFARIADVSEGAISLSRAYYWLGRSADAGGPGDARAYYEKAARYGTAFYGQLAAARLGHTAIPAEYPAPSERDRENFALRPAVAALHHLEAAGYTSLSAILYRDLAGELTSPGELALLTAMAEERGDHHLALKIGKIAAGRGLNIGSLSHPIGAIPPSANIPSAGRALAYAIARQESEFNIGAVSSAGARGLLQLLPGTAKAMAREVGLGYFPQRLTTDAGYNAALGSAYLSDQLDRFDGSYILTFAGYNAGPARAQEWVSRYGDPRGKDIDTIVDWIERIPYPETRNYVQRVMENLEVYKMRLTGRFDIVGDLRQGR